MKRVLIFSLAYHPFVGGAEVAIKEITDRLDPKEYSFDMVTLRFNRDLPEIEKIGNVVVHRIGFSSPGAKVSDRAMPLASKLAKLLFPFTSAWKARALQRTPSSISRPRLDMWGGYDLVWAMMANHAGFGALFFKLLYPRVPYFLELQDGNTLSQVRARRPLVRLIWPLYRLVYLKADMIKAISRFIAHLAREIGYGGKVVVIPNAVDVAKFSAPVPEDETARLRARLEKSLGDIFLFTASRLVLSRGVEDVIRALPHLPLEVKLLVAGDGEDRGKLEAIAEEEGVSARVVFLGHVGHGELPAYFKVSDIFVRPSIIEGFGNAFVEAFAAGVPVVATRVGGIPDFLTEGVTGVFCKVRDPESVARAVKRYLDDPALVAKVVGNAKKLVAESYDWDLVARRMREEIFEPCLKSSGARAARV